MELMFELLEDYEKAQKSNADGSATKQKAQQNIAKDTNSKEQSNDKDRVVFSNNLNESSSNNDNDITNSI